MKMARKDVEIIEVEKEKGDWTRKDEEERRRQAKLREQEEAEWKRKEEATRRKLEDLERKEREILEKERRLQEDIRRKEEQRHMEEQRREEERRLIEIRQREEELIRKEEKLKRMEMERRRNEELLRMEDERAHMERMRREQMTRSGGHQRPYPTPGLMEMRMHPSFVPGAAAGFHGGQRGHGPLQLPPSHHQPQPYGRFADPRSGRPSGIMDSRGYGSGRGGSSFGRGGAVPNNTAVSVPGRGRSSSSRASAFNRLGPKMPVKARLGGSKPGAADR